ncbi:hypothetical protein LRR81_11565 [Metabacillus sp. GX 13764]|uniref:hypothetical protein n=1 Tax=Metabacillus kandeliae TaxID=2900151 RepID=UPI001E42E105|nr:hypothetical protein [Metabacillus kandeliae]MCD7034884.1 hypothetical protein [Metabacillus kandeliae]
MEFLMVFSIHFFIMGILVLIGSGIISFLMPRMYFVFTVLLSMLAGYLYTLAFGVVDYLLWFALIFNGTLSLIAIGLVKIGLFAKNKADSLEVE